MKIANPLYDHAFKYLMSNDKLARKVLSVILDKEVLELELSQQEIVVEDEERRFTLYRLDFKALIRDENGREEMTLIELQKSKLPTNLLRFRNYLGLAYAQKTRVKNPATQAETDAALPIISIYILGYNIEDIPVMATRVDRRITDLSRKEELHIESDFIDLLTHTCYILQARRLPPQRPSRIEQFMTLFNQAWVQEHKFILDLEEVPEEFKDIAEYLQRPLQEEEIRKRLQAEEEVEALFALQEAEKEQLRMAVEEERRQKEEALKREEEARAQARENALKLARLLLKTGASAEEVARETGLPPDEVRRMAESLINYEYLKAPLTFFCSPPIIWDNRL
jgi:hypothetical protein